MRRSLRLVVAATLAGSGAAWIGVAGSSAVGLGSPRSTAFVGTPSTMCPAPLSGAQYDGLTVRSGKRTIALTFDDGPGRSTQAIISILESFHVRATFFNVGTGEVSWPSLVQDEARDGFLLGDHTVDHPELTSLPPSQQAYEMDGVIHEQRVLVDSSPCVFRPPYGAYDSTTLSLANQRRMTLWMWNNSGADWMAQGSGSAYWIDRIISLAEGEGINQQHAVVLLHNQRIFMPATVAALPAIITFFLRHGYAFEDLLGRYGPPGTCADVPGVMPGVPSTVLASGARLGSGDSISSPGGQFVLTMRQGGNLVLTIATGRELFSTRTGGNPGAVAIVDPSGKVIVRAPGGQVLWSSGTAGHPGARLAVQADGNLTVGVGKVQLWSSSSRVSQLLPGERLKGSWRLTSPDGRCRLIQQLSGPLTLLAADGQVLWNSGTSHEPRATTALETNGNIAILSSSWSALWQSVTAGHRGARLSLTNQGQLVLSSRGVGSLWVTP